MGIINVGISKARRLLMLVLLLLCTANSFFLRAQNATDATTAVAPNASFNPTALNVFVGQLSFTRPTLSVTDPNTKKPIRGKFIERWSIKDKDGKTVTTSETVDNRVKFTDPTTGTKVSLLYGLDSIGNRAGTFTVVDSLLPLPRYKDQYTEAEASYKVTVSSPTVTAEYYNGSTKLTGESTLQIYNYKTNGGVCIPPFLCPPPSSIISLTILPMT